MTEGPQAFFAVFFFAVFFLFAFFLAALAGFFLAVVGARAGEDRRAGVALEAAGGAPDEVRLMSDQSE